MAKKKKGAKQSGYRVSDLSKVEVRRVIDRGWHPVRIKDVEVGEGEKGSYFKWKFEVSSGKFSGANPKPYYTSLNKDSLWNFKTLLEAAGFPIPSGDFNFDPTDLIGSELWVLIDHEVYEGKRQSVVIELSNEAQEDDSEDEDEDDSEDEDEDDSEDDEDSDDEDEDDSEDDEDSDDEDEDDSDELTEESINDMSEEDLEELCEEYDLDVDLSKFKTLTKMRKEVIKKAKKSKLF